MNLRSGNAVGPLDRFDIPTDFSRWLGPTITAGLAALGYRDWWNVVRGRIPATGAIVRTMRLPALTRRNWNVYRTRRFFASRYV